MKCVCLGNGLKHGKDCFREFVLDEQEMVRGLGTGFNYP